MLLCSQSNGSAINDSKGEVICSQTEQLAMLLSTKQSHLSVFGSGNGQCNFVASQKAEWLIASTFDGS